MGDVVHTSAVRLWREAGALRLARLPSEHEPVTSGTHGAIARHDGATGEVPDPHVTSLDDAPAISIGWSGPRTSMTQPPGPQGGQGWLPC
jgi:hypothetical protein